MMTDPIRKRLTDVDPLHPGVAVPQATTESSRALLEEIMTVDTKERPEQKARPRWIAAAAAAVTLVVGVGAAMVLTGGSGSEAPVAQGPALKLSAGAGDAMASCIAFSVEELARAPLAFAGTATAVEGDQAVLTVDRWFKGGDASQVIISAPQGLEALISGFAIDVGAQYLITAYEGTVNYCGFSGPSTPELQSAFEQAFPG